MGTLISVMPAAADLVLWDYGFTTPEGSDDARGQDRIPSKEIPAGKRDRPLILIADDEPLIRETLMTILEAEGYEVIGVADGQSAVEQALAAEPDVILADVAMPRMNGIDAAKKIRAVLPNTGIVLFSGQAETAGLLDQARREGHDFDVVPKPVRPEYLLALLKSARGK